MTNSPEEIYCFCLLHCMVSGCWNLHQPLVMVKPLEALKTLLIACSQLEMLFTLGFVVIMCGSYCKVYCLSKTQMAL